MVAKLYQGCPTSSQNIQNDWILSRYTKYIFLVMMVAEVFLKMFFTLSTLLTSLFLANIFNAVIQILTLQPDHLFDFSSTTYKHLWRNWEDDAIRNSQKMLKALVPTRSLKLSCDESTQYLEGWHTLRWQVH